MSTPSKFLSLKNLTVDVANSRRVAGVATIRVNGFEPIFHPPTATKVFMEGLAALMPLNRSYLEQKVNRQLPLYSHGVGGNRRVNTIDERRSKIVINRVFDFHLSSDW